MGEGHDVTRNWRSTSDPLRDHFNREHGLTRRPGNYSGLHCHRKAPDRHRLFGKRLTRIAPAERVENRTGLAKGAC